MLTTRHGAGSAEGGEGGHVGVNAVHHLCPLVYGVSVRTHSIVVGPSECPERSKSAQWPLLSPRYNLVTLTLTRFSSVEGISSLVFLYYSVCLVCKLWG